MEAMWPEASTSHWGDNQNTLSSYQSAGESMNPYGTLTDDDGGFFELISGKRVSCIQEEGCLDRSDRWRVPRERREREEALCTCLLCLAASLVIDS